MNKAQTSLRPVNKALQQVLITFILVLKKKIKWRKKGYNMWNPRKLCLNTFEVNSEKLILCVCYQGIDCS